MSDWSGLMRGVLVAACDQHGRGPALGSQGDSPILGPETLNNCVGARSRARRSSTSIPAVEVRPCLVGLLKPGSRLIRHIPHFILRQAESPLTLTLFRQILGRVE